MVAVVTTLPPLSSTLTVGWVPQVAPLGPAAGLGAEGQLAVAGAHGDVERCAGAAEPGTVALRV